MAKQVYKVCVITSLPQTDTKDRDGLYAGTYNADLARRRRRFDWSSWRGFWFSLKHVLVMNSFVGCGALGVMATQREEDRGWRVFVPAFRLGEVFPVQMLEPGNPDDDRCEEVGWKRKPGKFGGVTYRLFDLADILYAIELSYDIADLEAWLGCRPAGWFPVGAEFDAFVKRMRGNSKDRQTKEDIAPASKKGAEACVLCGSYGQCEHVYFTNIKYPVCVKCLALRFARGCPPIREERGDH